MAGFIFYMTISASDIEQYQCMIFNEFFYTRKIISSYQRETILRLYVNLNKVGSSGKMSSMQKKCHRWYYVYLLISEYLSCDLQIILAIDATKMSSAIFLYSRINISQIPQIYTIRM